MATMASIIRRFTVWGRVGEGGEKSKVGLNVSVVLFAGLFLFAGIHKLVPFPLKEVHEKLKEGMENNIYPKVWNWSPFNELFKTAENLRLFIGCSEVLGGTALVLSHFSGFYGFEKLVIANLIIVLALAGYTHVAMDDVKGLSPIVFGGIIVVQERSRKIEQDVEYSNMNSAECLA
eukprot:jgi/Bigna1/90508/estExt_fgenesh1_pg.C_720042